MRPLTLVAISALVTTTALAPATSAKSSAVDTSTAATTSASASWKDRPRYQPRLPGGYRNLVVLFQENHSFDNLYGGWGRVGRQRVEGLPQADRRHTIQRAQDGTRYRCLPQVDVNLTSPPLPVTCTDSRARHHQRVPQPAVLDRRLHRADRHDLSGPRRRAAERDPERPGTAGWMHP